MFEISPLIFKNKHLCMNILRIFNKQLPSKERSHIPFKGSWIPMDFPAFPWWAIEVELSTAPRSATASVGDPQTGREGRSLLKKNWHFCFFFKNGTLSKTWMDIWMGLFYLLNLRNCAEQNDGL